MSLKDKLEFASSFQAVSGHFLGILSLCTVDQPEIGSCLKIIDLLVFQ